jgi:hypothetical protein
MIWRAITFTTIAFISGTLGFWTADKEAPTRINRVEVLDNAVPPGGTVRIRYHVNRVRSCPVQIDRILYDAQRSRTTLEDLTFAASPGPLGDDAYIVQLRVPNSFVEGPATYQTIARYECNPLQRLWPIIVQAPGVAFNVVGPPVPSVPRIMIDPP